MWYNPVMSKMCATNIARSKVSPHFVHKNPPADEAAALHVGPLHNAFCFCILIRRCPGWCGGGAWGNFLEGPLTRTSGPCPPPPPLLCNYLPSQSLLRGSDGHLQIPGGRVVGAEIGTACAALNPEPLNDAGAAITALSVLCALCQQRWYSSSKRGLPHFLTCPAQDGKGLIRSSASPTCTPTRQATDECETRCQFVRKGPWNAGYSRKLCTDGACLAHQRNRVDGRAWGRDLDAPGTFFWPFAFRQHRLGCTICTFRELGCTAIFALRCYCGDSSDIHPGVHSWKPR